MWSAMMQDAVLEDAHPINVATAASGISLVSADELPENASAGIVLAAKMADDISKALNEGARKMAKRMAQAENDGPQVPRFCHVYLEDGDTIRPIFVSAAGNLSVIPRCTGPKCTNMVPLYTKFNFEPICGSPEGYYRIFVNGLPLIADKSGNIICGQYGEAGTEWLVTSDDQSGYIIQPSPSLGMSVDTQWKRSWAIDSLHNDNRSGTPVVLQNKDETRRWNFISCPGPSSLVQIPNINRYKRQKVQFPLFRLLAPFQQREK